MINKGARWDLRSIWTIRPQRRPTTATSKSDGYHGALLFEHEVTVSSANSSVELVARFVHALPQARASARPFARGGLVSLVIRNRNYRGRHPLKRLDVRALSEKLQPRLKSIDVSPQSRGAISGSSSPVSVPLAIPTNPVIVPLGPAKESSKEDIGAAAPILPSPVAILPEQTCADLNVSPIHGELPADATAAQTLAWLRSRRFHSFESTFSSFSASDILRLSRDDLIQICGLADGIRLYNALHARAPQPKLSLYFAVEGAAANGAGAGNPGPNSGSAGLWRAVYLENLSSGSLTRKLLAVLGLGPERLHSVLLLGPQGIHVLVTNELVANMRDESMFVVETIKEHGTDRYKLLLKPSSH